MELLRKLGTAILCFVIYLTLVWAVTGRLIAKDDLEDSRSAHIAETAFLRSEIATILRWNLTASMYTIRQPKIIQQPVVVYRYPIHPEDYIELSSPYGERNPYEIGGWGDAFHDGLDLWGISRWLTWQARIVAVADGKVIEHWNPVDVLHPALGGYVRVQHKDGSVSSYGHLSSTYVWYKQEVKAGDVLGRQGATGQTAESHLHFELEIDGVKVNPLRYIKM